MHIELAIQPCLQHRIFNHLVRRKSRLSRLLNMRDIVFVRKRHLPLFQSAVHGPNRYQTCTLTTRPSRLLVSSTGRIARRHLFNSRTNSLYPPPMHVCGSRAAATRHERGIAQCSTSVSRHLQRGESGEDQRAEILLFVSRCGVARYRMIRRGLAWAVRVEACLAYRGGGAWVCQGAWGEF